jgi:hypothetical protein
MEVHHKPKPFHGWREFLKEYVIIVVGVLTALAAEAVVQDLHERRLSAEARESVRSELNSDITNVAHRFSYEPCVQRRLAELRSLLDRAEAGQTVSPGPVGAPAGRLIRTQQWETATAGGRTSLLPSDEQANFGRVYGSLAGLSATQQMEREAWVQLDALEGLRRLSPEMIYGSRIALSRAVFADRWLQGIYDQTKFFAGRIGIKGNAQLVYGTVDLPGVATICQPLEPARDG